MRRIFKKILLTINILLVVSLFLSYISVQIPPDKWWIPAFFGMAYPIILVINSGFFIFWLIFKPKYSFISLIPILMGITFIFKYYQLFGKNQDKKDIKIISYNVKLFQGTENSSPVINANNIKEYLKSENADIICLQEVRLRSNEIFNISEIIQGFPSINHYQYATTSQTGGSLTLTRYPIVHMGEIRFENSGNIAIFSDILINTDTFRVINTHLQSYKINPSQYSIIDSLDISKENLEIIRIKLKQGFMQRAEQARIIREEIEKSPYPVMVCGDFNDTPVSYSYNTVKGDLIDAFINSGKGFGRTYNGKLPSFRIDYILHSNYLGSDGFTSDKVYFSDHFPVKCNLFIR